MYPYDQWICHIVRLSNINHLFTYVIYFVHVNTRFFSHFIVQSVYYVMGPSNQCTRKYSCKIIISFLSSFQHISFNLNYLLIYTVLRVLIDLKYYTSGAKIKKITYEILYHRKKSYYRPYIYLGIYILVDLLIKLLPIYDCIL